MDKISVKDASVCKQEEMSAEREREVDSMNTGNKGVEAIEPKTYKLKRYKRRDSKNNIEDVI